MGSVAYLCDRYLVIVCAEERVHRTNTPAPLIPWSESDPGPLAKEAVSVNNYGFSKSQTLHRVLLKERFVSVGSLA